MKCFDFILLFDNTKITIIFQYIDNMKKLQTFEGFMDLFKDKFKMALDRVNDNLKDIPGIERKDYPPLDNPHRFPNSN